MLAVEIASFMVVVANYANLVLGTLELWNRQQGLCSRYLHLHVVTAISPFLCLLYLFTVAAPWCFRSSVSAAVPTGCYFQLYLINFSYIKYIHVCICTPF